MEAIESVGVDGYESALGNEVTQSDWGALLLELRWACKNDQTLDMSIFLRERGFTNVIRGITSHTSLQDPCKVVT
ncbi:hypothetical protein [Candidatus Neptunochlamydia vexilliferae]|uniref:Uncharacterized protein n=1 Tax=Candidatus Neptunichlamydia vexilliferae TaxID=1651774 RepID=A0ABS0B0W9_9BACT|nr:hypothetical protein [Candidatus Neptunochlamydia vexilliferae]MBF5060035.1 hypothetical protein [Candidatus Neptunochlamydia vexilliferae]